MPNTAPGTERIADGVNEDAAPAAKARVSPRTWRLLGVGVFLLVIAVLFDAYLHLSKTYPENSDEANILLMANDMLHGNVILHNWSVSDVPFITTELPQIALLVWMFGLHLNTAHIAAAVTYTLIVAVSMLLAKGKARGWAGVARMALALAIMIAPQPGVGIFVVVFSVGHIGTALPVLLTWLALDRLGRTWYVAVLVAVLLGWALTADPLVLVVAILPLLAVCLARVVSALVLGVRDGGLRGLRAAALDRWFEVALAAAAGIGYLIAFGAGQLINHSGGFVQQPVPYQLDWSKLYMHSQIVVHGLLEMFGAYFVPGVDTYIQWPIPPAAPGGLDQAIALSHLVGVVLAVWGACAIARRFFFRDADIVSQLLLAGIVANIAAYVPSTLANHTALNVREIAPVLPFAAVLAGRMLGDRLATGPLATIRLYASRKRDRVKAGRPALRLRLVAVPLVLLFGWYSFGLFRQADTPAAPLPFTNVAAFLQSKGLTYGLGGYWEASLITLETDGAVTIRAVTPACLQPYKWESKSEWYDPAKNTANFLLLSNKAGFFSKFAVSSDALLLLNKRVGPPHYRNHRWPVYWDTGNFQILPALNNGKPVIKNGRPVYVQVWDYTARQYPVNLLSEFKPLSAALSSPTVNCG